MAILLDLQDIGHDAPDRTLVQKFSFTISDGDRVGVVGINGTGKSTLLRIIAGALRPDRGAVRRGKNVSVAYLEQIPVIPEGTVRDALGGGWQTESTLDTLGMLDQLNSPISSLSGGQLKRVALARIFTNPADVLVLDEPTNHLDLHAIEWLEQQIRSFKGAIVLVSHDRFLLDQVTTRMVEIDRGQTFLHAGGYAKLLETQAEREELASRTEATRRNMARRELAWLRRGVKARATKPQARIDAAQRLLATKADGPARVGTLDFVTDTPRLGNTVIKAHNVSFAYGAAAPTIQGVTIEIGPGDRIGVVGPNGAGKSTFVNLLAQQLEPTVGTMKHGPTVVLAYFDQTGALPNENLTVQELVAGPGGVPGSVSDIALMKRFWFAGALCVTPAKELSGGERRRLQLLLALALRPNVMILDEPTNDLDLETIRLIEDFLSEWPGTLIVVSHDRTFLSQTTDRLLEVRPDGSVGDIPGGIDMWIARSLKVGLDDDIRADSDAPASASNAKLAREAGKDVSRLERQIAKMAEKIAATSDYEEAGRRTKDMDALRQQLTEAEERWLRLSSS